MFFLTPMNATFTETIYVFVFLVNLSVALFLLLFTYPTLRYPMKTANNIKMVAALKAISEKTKERSDLVNRAHGTEDITEKVELFKQVQSINIELVKLEREVIRFRNES